MTAHTASPVDWYACPPDSGYSVDNLAPGVPGGFRVEHGGDGASLAWDESPEEDFQFFRVYRGDNENFPIGPETLVHETVETGWVDAEGEAAHFYLLTALDHAGNESAAAAPDQVIGIDDPDTPRTFALHQNSPNPFNPSTTIHFEVARQGDVRLTIFDVAGRRVATLLDGPFAAGRHEAVWRGESDTGRPVGSGQYFYRLEAAGFVQTRKMLLLQ